MVNIDELRKQQQALLQRQQILNQTKRDPATGQSVLGPGGGRVLGNISASIQRDYNDLQNQINQATIEQRRAEILSKGGGEAELRSAGVTEQQQASFQESRRAQPQNEVLARQAVRYTPEQLQQGAPSVRQQVEEAQRRALGNRPEPQTPTSVGQFAPGRLSQQELSQRAANTSGQVRGQTLAQATFGASPGFSGKLLETKQRIVQREAKTSQEIDKQQKVKLQQVFQVLRKGSEIEARKALQQGKDLFKQGQISSSESIARNTRITQRSKEFVDELNFFLPKQIEGYIDPYAYKAAFTVIGAEERQIVPRVEPALTALGRNLKPKEAQVYKILDVLQKRIPPSEVQTPVSDFLVGFGKAASRPTIATKYAAEAYGFGALERFGAKVLVEIPGGLELAGSPFGQFLGTAKNVALVSGAVASEAVDVYNAPKPFERLGETPVRFAGFGLGFEAERATLGGVKVRQTRFGEPFGEIQREAAIQKGFKSPQQRELLRTLAALNKELRVKGPEPTPTPLQAGEIPGEATLAEKQALINVIREEKGTVFGSLTTEKAFGERAPAPKAADIDVAFKNQERALNKLDFDINTPEQRSARFERATGGLLAPESLGDIKPLSDLQSFAFIEKPIRLKEGEGFTRQSEQLGRLLDSFLTPGRLARRGEKDIGRAKGIAELLLEEQGKVATSRRRAARLQQLGQRFAASKDVQFTFFEQPSESFGIRLGKRIDKDFGPFRANRDIFEELGINRRKSVSGNDVEKTLRKAFAQERIVREPLRKASPQERADIFRERQAKEIENRIKPLRETSFVRSFKEELPSVLPSFKSRRVSALPQIKITSKIPTSRQTSLVPPPRSPYKPPSSPKPNPPSPRGGGKPSKIPTPSIIDFGSSIPRPSSEFGFSEIPPPPFRLPKFGLKGGEIASTREGRSYQPKQKYAPSLTGILRGVRISKVPTTSFSGFEVRGVPVKRLGGLAGNLNIRSPRLSKRYGLSTPKKKSLKGSKRKTLLRM